MFVGLALSVALSMGGRPANAQSLPVLPVVRLGVGAASHVAPSETARTEVAFDAAAGVWMLDVVDLIHVGGETGYTCDPVLGLNAFHLAASIGLGDPLLFGSYNARFVAGDSDLGGAVGMRNSISAHALADLASFELGHQFVDAGDTLHHDIRGMFRVNLATPVLMLVASGNIF